jgi:UDP-N-acetylglucosamine 2-epimerase
MSTAQLLGNFGEFLGAIAVVATLLYLAVQVRHSKMSLDENTRVLEENRKLTRETMLFQLSDRWDKVEHLATEDREIASIFVRGNANPDELDEVDQTIYTYRLGTHFNTHLMFHRIAASGFLDKDIIRFSDENFRTSCGRHTAA